jgi:hypothetical protein
MALLSNLSRNWRRSREVETDVEMDRAWSEFGMWETNFVAGFYVHLVVGGLQFLTGEAKWFCVKQVLIYVSGS